MWEQKASEERADSAGTVALGVLVGLAAVAVAVAASQPTYYPPPRPVTTTCNHFGRRTTCTTD